MALTATASQGFEFLRTIDDCEVMYVPGKAATTYTRGDAVTWTVGDAFIDVAAANEGGVVGWVLQTTVVPANTVAFPRPADFNPTDRATSANLTLVPIRLSAGADMPIRLATFASHFDDTVVTYSAASRYIACTTGMAADDRPNGALLYVYEGPGAGEVNIVEDYDHTGGAVELLLQLARPFNATLTSASKFIVLAGEAAASRGIGPFGHLEADNNNLLCNQGADDGDYVCVLNWQDAGRYLAQLKLPTIQSRHWPLV